MSKIRQPLCKHCGNKTNTTRAIYCSRECYTKSGHRKAMGKINGAKTPTKFKKIRKRVNCILDLDSPSYPPRTEEYRQCGCKDCVRYIRGLNAKGM